MKPSNAVREYLAAIGREGGQSTSDAKAEAARKNGAMPCGPGKKRGRPRKTK